MHPEVMRPRLRPIYSVAPIIAFAVVCACLGAVNAMRYLELVARPEPSRRVVEVWSTMTIVEPVCRAE